MQKNTRLLLPFVLTFVACATGCNPIQKSTKMNPNNLPPAPIAAQVAHTTIAHDDTLVDNYYWLRYPKDTNVINYLNAENAYTQAAMAHTVAFQQVLFDEMKSRIKQDDATAPQLNNGYYYYTRYETGKEYPIHCRKKGNLQATEEIILDVNILAAGKDFCAVTGINISPNNQLLAYGIDVQGRNIFMVYIKDLTTGALLPDHFNSGWGGSTWANDSRTIFYDTKNDETLRSEKIYKHTIGTDAKADPMIYHEKNESYYLSVDKTKDDKYITINIESTLNAEVRYISADAPNDEFKIFAPRTPNHLYSVEHYEGNFLILTNYQAKNYKIMQCAAANTDQKNWVDAVAHRTDVLVEDIEVFKDFWVLAERKDGLPQLHIYNQNDKTNHCINFGEADYDASAYYTPEYNSDKVRYYYSSLSTPNSVYDYDMTTKQRTIVKEQEVLGGFDKNNYATERIYTTTADGAKVPVSIVYKKGLKKDGTAPLLLYGYGSYGASMESSFRSSVISLLDRGFVYAIAHIRGGKEMGETWYDDGKLLNKKNTFTDFVACADDLVDKKYAAPDKVFGMGGSAGGLLMGAVANMRPDRWRGIIAAVPFVDVINTMLDATIPLTTNEYDEWGNPNDKIYYDYMKSYSPYDNVEAKNYPNMLITTGLHDSQVQYWEPAKWTAKLRHLKTDQNILLLYTNMQAGHGGKSGRFERLKEIAMEYAFMLDLLGIGE